MSEDNISDPDGVIHRLILENSRLRRQLEELQDLIATAYPDAYHLSVLGSIEKLLRRLQLLEQLIKEAKMECPGWSS